MDISDESPTSHEPARSARRAPSFRRGNREGKVGPKKPLEVIKTWAFDSAGTRKYAMQLRKAGNGNPCLKIVEGVPQPDGTFRRFDLTFWSEDWSRLFEVLDEVRGFIAQNNIRTPDGHKYEPVKWWARNGAGTAAKDANR
jgi:hypothetical protein